MSQTLPIERKETKCPLGFKSWFGKTPDFVKNNQTDAIRLNDEIKTNIQCQNQSYYSQMFGQTQELLPLPTEQSKIIIPAKIQEDQQSEFDQKYGDILDRYNELPKKLTNLKKSYIFSNQDTNQRFISLMLVTLATAGVSRFTSKGPLTMLRNVIIGYYGWGLMITPEIYNHKISEN